MTPNETAPERAVGLQSAIDNGPTQPRPRLIDIPGGIQSTPARAFVSLSFIAGYAAIIYFFSIVDVYTQHFFDKNYSIIYNIVRIIFGFYLFFFLYGTGKILINLFDRHGRVAKLACSGKIITFFFSGAIAWQFLMLTLGYLNLYVRSIIILLTIPNIVWASLIFPEISTEIAQTFRARLAEYGRFSRASTIALSLILVISACLLASVKGLYPAGGHDYYTHYFYYYIMCLKNHGIWPNDVWYHYFYSKGEGIYFLGMLLTDPLAPSVVTYCFVAVATIALFSFVDRMAPNSLWPWTASIGWMLILLYDGGQTGLKVDGSNYWGEFPKEHEINAAFVMVVVWFVDGLLREDSAESRILLWAASGCAFAVAYIEQPTPIFIGLFTVLLTGALAWRRRFRKAAEFLALACAAGAGFVSNLAINYLTTGLPSDAFINIAWPVLNLKKINALGWMWPVILHSENLAGVSGSFGRLTPAIFGDQLLAFAHLAGLRAWFGYAPGAAFVSGSVIIFCIGRRRIPERMRPSVLLITGLTASFVVSAIMGALLPDSFYRYSSFFVPVEFAIGAALWLLAGEMSKPQWARRMTSLAAPVIALAFFAHQLWSNDGTHLKTIVEGSVQFVSGQRSIYDAYVDQADWPSRMPFGAIYPGSLAAWEELGPEPHPRVWSFHIHSYCMLPGCLWETDRSFPGSPHMFDVLFGSPDSARDILQREGLNYFLYSRDLQIRDVLPAAELFSPERIADYLGIKWTDGTSYLLTWLGPGVQPLDGDWLARYRQQVSESGEVRGFRGHRVVMRAVYEQLQSNPKWGYEVKPQWLR